MTARSWNRKALKSLPTLYQGQCGHVKVETPAVRVWLCRVGGGVTVEQYAGHEGWRVVAGDCMDTADEALVAD